MLFLHHKIHGRWRDQDGTPKDQTHPDGDECPASNPKSGSDHRRRRTRSCKKAVNYSHLNDPYTDDALKADSESEKEDDVTGPDSGSAENDSEEEEEEDEYELSEYEKLREKRIKLRHEKFEAMGWEINDRPTLADAVPSSPVASGSEYEPSSGDESNDSGSGSDEDDNLEPQDGAGNDDCSDERDDGGKDPIEHNIRSRLANKKITKKISIHFELPKLEARHSKKRAEKKIAKKIRKINANPTPRVKKMDRNDSEYVDTSFPEPDRLGDIISGVLREHPDANIEDMSLASVLDDEDELLFEGPDNDDGSAPEQIVLEISRRILTRKAADAPVVPEAVVDNPPVESKKIMAGRKGPGTSFVFVKDPKAPFGVKIKVPDMPRWERYRFALRQRWEKMFKMLEDYKEENGDCLVPASYPPNQKLSTWVHTQRREHQQLQRGEQSSMTSERIRRLEAIDFAWDAQAEIWSQMFKMLEDYKEENGDCLVPNRYPPKQKLSTWVKKQRQEYRLLQRGEQSSMTSERIRRLEAIDFAWDAQAENWSQMFKMMEEYLPQRKRRLPGAKQVSAEPEAEHMGEKTTPRISAAAKRRAIFNDVRAHQEA